MELKENESVVAVVVEEEGVRKCNHCNRTETPLWRKDPDAIGYLCNACGLYQKMKKKKRPYEHLNMRVANYPIEIKSPIDENMEASARVLSCFNCNTNDTPLWRRCPTSPTHVICNACGLYYRVHGSHRPLSFAMKQKKKCLLNENDSNSINGLNLDSEKLRLLRIPLSDILIAQDETGRRMVERKLIWGIN